MDLERAVKYNQDHYNLWVTLKPDEFARLCGGWAALSILVGQYQSGNGLDPDGKLGPKTIAILQAPGLPGTAGSQGGTAPGTAGAPPWYQVALSEMGTTEIPGRGSNPAVEKYHASTSLGESPDDVPWCSSFANWCMEKAGIKGTGSAWARSWLNWGEGLSVPRLGCIVVFSRGPVSGHVAFFRRVGLGGKIDVLGGNQSNQVRFSLYNQQDVLGYRWPAGYHI